MDPRRWSDGRAPRSRARRGDRLRHRRRRRARRRSSDDRRHPRGARRLLDAGFEPDRGGARGYRFVRDGATVDVLAPDNVGARAELRTVPPETTVPIVGGTQALARAREVEVHSGDGPFQIRIPTLAGAIVIKSP